MQPVEPSTIVRGPDALTMSFMTSADSQPWQVRCPDVKYSSIVTRLTPRNGSRICVAFVNVVVSAMVISLFIAASRPAGPSPATAGNGQRYSRTPSQWVLESDFPDVAAAKHMSARSEEHTSELQSPCNLVCRL